MDPLSEYTYWDNNGLDGQKGKQLITVHIQMCMKVTDRMYDPFTDKTNKRNIKL